MNPCTNFGKRFKSSNTPVWLKKGSHFGLKEIMNVLHTEHEME